MRLPIPHDMRACQLWAQTVPVNPRPQYSTVPIARVQVPPEYERSWSIALAPIVQNQWIGGVRPGSEFLYASSGIYAVITFGTCISQFRVIDWPWGGGVFGVRGSAVSVDLRLSPAIVFSGGQPPTVSAEIMDVEPSTLLERSATFSEDVFQQIGAAVASQSPMHSPPRGTIGVRVQALALVPPQTEPSGSLMMQGFSLGGVVNMGPPALMPQWQAWGGANAQSGSLESLADLNALRLIRTVAATTGADTYRLQYRIDL